MLVCMCVKYNESMGVKKERHTQDTKAKKSKKVKKLKGVKV